MKVLGTFILLLALQAFGATEGWAQSSSYFVVLATFDAYGGSPSFDSAEQVKRSAARCGVEAWNEYTSKIKGFRAGYFAVILGPFAARAQAEAQRQRVLPCVPGAYLKSGVHLGE